MRLWSKMRRLLALVFIPLYLLVAVALPAFAASRSFSAPRSGGFGSGSRSFSAPKPSAPKPSAPSRSFSSPKAPAPTTSAPSRSFSSPDSPSYSTDPKGFTSPTSPSYSSGSRSYSGESRSFSSQRSSGAPAGSAAAPPAAYDTSQTRYPTRPPVVIFGPSPYDPGYWHDYYYGRPFWWRMWYRPVYYSDTGWAYSWISLVGSGLVLWVLLGVVSATVFKRRK